MHVCVCLARACIERSLRQVSTQRIQQQPQQPTTTTTTGYPIFISRVSCSQKWPWRYRLRGTTAPRRPCCCSCSGTGTAPCSTVTAGNMREKTRTAVEERRRRTHENIKPTTTIHVNITYDSLKCLSMLQSLCCTHIYCFRDTCGVSNIHV